MEKQFLKFAAYLQIMGIILVVLGHSFHEYPEHGMNMLLYRMMHNFRMPLFLFVSGFLMYYTARLGETGVLSFARKKVERLLLPFLFLTVVTFIPRSLMSGMADDVIEADFHRLWHGLIYGDRLVIPYFWFLQVSFTLLLISYGGLWMLRHSMLARKTYVIALTLVFALLTIWNPEGITSVWSLDMTVRLGVYFMSGVLFGIFYVEIMRRVDFTNLMVALLFAVAWVLLFMNFEGETPERLASVFGILMCISVAMMMERYNIVILDCFIGANYMIFLLSWYFNVASQQVLHHFVELPRWSFTILSLVSGVFCPWLLYRYMQRNQSKKWVRGAAFLLGQSLKKNDGK